MPTTTDIPAEVQPQGDIFDRVASKAPGDIFDQVAAKQPQTYAESTADILGSIPQPHFKSASEGPGMEGVTATPQNLSATLPKPDYGPDKDSHGYGNPNFHEKLATAARSIDTGISGAVHKVTGDPNAPQASDGDPYGLMDLGAQQRQKEAADREARAAVRIRHTDNMPAPDSLTAKAGGDVFDKLHGQYLESFWRNASPETKELIANAPTPVVKEPVERLAHPSGELPEGSPIRLAQNYAAAKMKEYEGLQAPSGPNGEEPGMLAKAGAAAADAWKNDYPRLKRLLGADFAPSEYFKDALKKELHSGVLQDRLAATQLLPLMNLIDQTETTPSAIAGAMKAVNAYFGNLPAIAAELMGAEENPFTTTGQSPSQQAAGLVGDIVGFIRTPKWAQPGFAKGAELTAMAGGKIAVALETHMPAFAKWVDKLAKNPVAGRAIGIAGEVPKLAVGSAFQAVLSLDGFERLAAGEPFDKVMDEKFQAAAAAAHPSWETVAMAAFFKIRHAQGSLTPMGKVLDVMQADAKARGMDLPREDAEMLYLLADDAHKAVMANPKALKAALDEAKAAEPPAQPAPAPQTPLVPLADKYHIVQPGQDAFGAAPGASGVPSTGAGSTPAALPSTGAGAVAASSWGGVGGLGAGEGQYPYDVVEDNSITASMGKDGRAKIARNALEAFPEALRPKVAELLSTHEHEEAKELQRLETDFPGESKDAHYQRYLKAHPEAEKIERAKVEAAGIDWVAYQKALKPVIAENLTKPVEDNPAAIKTHEVVAAEESTPSPAPEVKPPAGVTEENLRDPDFIAAHLGEPWADEAAKHLPDEPAPEPPTQQAEKQPPKFGRQAVYDAMVASGGKEQADAAIGAIDAGVAEMRSRARKAGKQMTAEQAWENVGAGEFGDGRKGMAQLFSEMIPGQTADRVRQASLEGVEKEKAGQAKAPHKDELVSPVAKILDRPGQDRDPKAVYLALHDEFKAGTNALFNNPADTLAEVASAIDEATHGKVLFQTNTGAPPEAEKPAAPQAKPETPQAPAEKPQSPAPPIAPPEAPKQRQTEGEFAAVYNHPRFSELLDLTTRLNAKRGPRPTSAELQEGDRIAGQIVKDLGVSEDAAHLAAADAYRGRTPVQASVAPPAPQQFGASRPGRQGALFSKTSNTIKGATYVDGVKAVMSYAQGKSDFSTFVHEWWHAFDHVFGQYFTSAERIALDYYSVKDWSPARVQAEAVRVGVSIKDADLHQRVQKERTAQAFEQWFRTGKAPTPALKSIFSRIAAFINKVYEKIVNAKNKEGGPLIQLPPNVKAAFAAMHGSKKSVESMVDEGKARKQANALYTDVEAFASKHGFDPDAVQDIGREGAVRGPEDVADSEQYPATPSFSFAGKIPTEVKEALTAAEYKTAIVQGRLKQNAKKGGGEDYIGSVGLDTFIQQLREGMKGEKGRQERTAQWVADNATGMGEPDLAAKAQLWREVRDSGAPHDDPTAAIKEKAAELQGTSDYEYYSRPDVGERAKEAFKQQLQQPTNQLPPEEDRGDDPNAYQSVPADDPGKDYGQYIFSIGHRDETGWRERMVSEFGDEAKPHLARIWKDMEPYRNSIEPPGKKPTAIPGKVEPDGGPKPETTSIKNAVVDAELKAMGLPPATHGEKVTAAGLNEKAAQIEHDRPEAILDLKNELEANPRGVEPLEDVQLLRDRNRQRVYREKLEQQALDAAKAGDQTKMAILRVQIAAARADFERISNIVTRVGTPNAQALAMRRIMMKEDFSIATVERELMVAASRTDRPLNEKEVANIQAKAAELSKRLLASEERLADAEKAKAELQSKLDYAEAHKAMTAPEAVKASKPKADTPRRQGFGSRNKLFTKEAADKALSELQTMTFSVTSLPVEAATRLVKLAGYYIEGGLQSFAEFVEKVTTRLGRQVDEKHLRAAWDQGHKDLADASREKVATRIAKRKDQAFTPTDAEAIAKIFIAEGITGRSELLKAVHAELKKADPDITERQVQDALGGYGNRTELSQDETDKRMRQLHAEYQLESKIDDVLKQAEVLKSGRDREPMTDDARALLKQLNQLMAERGIAPGSELKSRLDTAKTRLQHEISDAEDRLAAHEDNRKGKPKLQYDVEAKALKAKLDMLHDQERRMFRSELLEAQLRLNSAKKRTAKSTELLRRKIADQDFAKRQKPTPIPEDKELHDARVKNAQVRSQYETAKWKYELGKRKWWEKALVFTAKAGRANILARVGILKKLSAAAAFRIPQIAAEYEIQAGLGYLAPKWARATTIGKFNFADATGAIGRGAARSFLKIGADAASAIKNGKLDIDYLYAKHPYTRDLPPSVFDFFAHAHLFLKAPAERFGFEVSYALREKLLAQQGHDISTPEAQALIGAQALMDGKRAIFSEDNRLSEGYSRMVRGWEQVNPVTGKQAAPGWAFLARSSIPFPKIPVNIPLQAAEHLYGLPVGIGRMILHRLCNGKQPPPAWLADSVMRQLTRGITAAPFLGLAWYYYQNIGSLYHQGQKREDELQPGEVKLGQTVIPKEYTHNTVTLGMMFVASVRRLYNAVFAKGAKHGQTPAEHEAVSEALYNATIDGFQEIPFFKETLPDPRGPGRAVASRVIPGFVSEAARYLDKDAQDRPIKRKPVGLIEDFKANIPGLRQDVPEDTKKR